MLHALSPPSAARCALALTYLHLLFLFCFFSLPAWSGAIFDNETLHLLVCTVRCKGYNSGMGIGPGPPFARGWLREATLSHAKKTDLAAHNPVEVVGSFAGVEDSPAGVEGSPAGVEGSPAGVEGSPAGVEDTAVDSHLLVEDSRTSSASWWRSRTTVEITKEWQQT